MKATIGTLLLCAICTLAVAQNDSINTPTVHDTLTIPRDTVVVASTQQRAIEIYRIKNEHTAFVLLKGRTVWIQCYKPRGKLRIKRARIAECAEHSITFEPFSARFDPITYDEDELHYISFTSFERIFGAALANIVIIGVVVVVIFFVAILDLLTGGSGALVGSNFDWVPLVPFRKTINFRQTRNSMQVWEFRIVPINQVATKYLTVK